mmetsp:Transcript_19445/g.44098  ORF Transcript_19445/g.44098 Transcript_19445/m.44098 type:complete len:370 (+) Transcript_19445:452-1561(+)
MAAATKTKFLTAWSASAGLSSRFVRVPKGPRAAASSPHASGSSSWSKLRFASRKSAPGSNKKRSLCRPETTPPAALWAPFVAEVVALSLVGVRRARRSPMTRALARRTHGWPMTSASDTAPKKSLASAASCAVSWPLSPSWEGAEASRLWTAASKAPGTVWKALPIATRLWYAMVHGGSSPTTPPGGPPLLPPARGEGPPAEACLSLLPSLSSTPRPTSPLASTRSSMRSPCPSASASCHPARVDLDPLPGRLRDTAAAAAAAAAKSAASASCACSRPRLDTRSFWRASRSCLRESLRFMRSGRASTQTPATCAAVTASRSLTLSGPPRPAPLPSEANGPNEPPPPGSSPAARSGLGLRLSSPPSPRLG